MSSKRGSTFPGIIAFEEIWVTFVALERGLSLATRFSYFASLPSVGHRVKNFTKVSKAPSQRPSLPYERVDGCRGCVTKRTPLSFLPFLQNRVEPLVRKNF